jgi:hypothetical protein
MRHVYGADGSVVATIDSSGRVTLGADPGAIVGLVRTDTDVFAGEAGVEWLGRVDSDRRVFDAQYQFVGSIDISGRVTDQTGRLVGTASDAVDGAALLLLVATLAPETVAPPELPPETESTVMDEVTALEEEHGRPGIRKTYKPLTDEDVFGKPHRKKDGR